MDVRLRSGEAEARLDPVAGVAAVAGIAAAVAVADAEVALAVLVADGRSGLDGGRSGRGGRGNGAGVLGVHGGLPVSRGAVVTRCVGKVQHLNNLAYVLEVMPRCFGVPGGGSGPRRLDASAGIVDRDVARGAEVAIAHL